MRPRLLSRILLLSCTLACGPFGPVAGGALDGATASSLPEDWSFTDDHWTVQLETRPSDPYSVNLWCVSASGQLYVASGEGPSSVWARALLEDPRARIGIGEDLYDVAAVRVTARPEIEVYLDALAKKYDLSQGELSQFEGSPGEPAAAVLFRLEGRTPTRAP